jgi:hypothetical protein
MPPLPASLPKPPAQPQAEQTLSLGGAVAVACKHAQWLSWKNNHRTVFLVHSLPLAVVQYVNSSNFLQLLSIHPSSSTSEADLKGMEGKQRATHKQAPQGVLHFPFHSLRSIGNSTSSLQLSPPIFSLAPPPLPPEASPPAVPSGEADGEANRMGEVDSRTLKDSSSLSQTGATRIISPAVILVAAGCC